MVGQVERVRRGELYFLAKPGVPAGGPRFAQHIAWSWGIGMEDTAMVIKYATAPTADLPMHARLCSESTRSWCKPTAYATIVWDIEVLNVKDYN